MNRFMEFCRTKPSTVAVGALVLFSLVLHVYATGALNSSYAASAFPVPYYEAQLSFDPDRLKAWYAYLLERKTLSIYIETQHIDFIFIASTLLLHFFALLFVSRLFPSSSRWRTGMIVCAILSSLAPIADAIENVVSYAMLANPLTFPGYLAYAYSSLAAIKFSMFVFAYAAAVIGVAFALIGYLTRLLRSSTRQAVS